jgi:hypothetical protein
LTEDDKKRANEHRSGSGGATGESVRPSSGSAEEPHHVEGESPVQEIPIGIPMTSEEFRRLKAQAERPSREEERQKEADEDASTTQEY